VGRIPLVDGKVRSAFSRSIPYFTADRRLLSPVGIRNADTKLDILFRYDRRGFVLQLQEGGWDRLEGYRLVSLRSVLLLSCCFLFYLSLRLCHALHFSSSSSPDRACLVSSSSYLLPHTLLSRFIGIDLILIPVSLLLFSSSSLPPPILFPVTTMTTTTTTTT
jgi:hypothetical protein